MAFTRGNTVFFKSIVFRDDLNAITEMDTATLTVSYPHDKTFEEEEITLIVGEDLTWSGQWDSGVSDAGTVHWTAVGRSDALTCVEDGKFKLTAGRANERETS